MHLQLLARLQLPVHFLLAVAGNVERAIQQRGAVFAADILADAPGCVSAPDEPGAFGRIVGTLLADPPACQALAEQAPITAAGWSDMAMAGRLADFYRKTLARHPAHRRVVQPAEGPEAVS